MHIPENSSDEELILMVDNKPNATPLERKLADHLAERKREFDAAEHELAEYNAKYLPL
jgi:hypothetical protein